MATKPTKKKLTPAQIAKAEHDVYLAQATPQLLAAEAQTNAASNALYLTGAEKSAAVSNLQRTTQLETKQNKLSEESTAASIALSQGQQKAAEEQQTQEQAQYREQQQQVGITEQQTQLQEAANKNQQKELAYQTPQAVRAQSGQAAAAGASNTVGNSQANESIQTTAGFNSETLKNTLAGLGLSESSNVLTGQIAEAAQKSEEAGYASSEAGLAGGRKQLQLQAKGQNISQEQLNQQHAYGLQQFGFQYDPTSAQAGVVSAEANQGSIIPGVVAAANASFGGSPFANWTQSQYQNYLKSGAVPGGSNG